MCMHVCGVNTQFCQNFQKIEFYHEILNLFGDRVATRSVNGYCEELKSQIKGCVKSETA